MAHANTIEYAKANALAQEVRAVLPAEAKGRAQIGPVDIGDFDVKGHRYKLVYGLTPHALRNLTSPGQDITYGQTRSMVVSLARIGKDGSVITNKPLAYDKDIEELPEEALGKALLHLDQVKAREIVPNWQIVRPQVRRTRPGAISY